MGDGKSKIGPLSHIKAKKHFQKKKKKIEHTKKIFLENAGVKCRDKLEKN